MNLPIRADKYTSGLPCRKRTELMRAALARKTLRDKP